MAPTACFAQSIGLMATAWFSTTISFSRGAVYGADLTSRLACFATNHAAVLEGIRTHPYLFETDVVLEVADCRSSARATCCGSAGPFRPICALALTGTNKIRKLRMNDPCCRVRIIFAIVRN